MYCREGGAGALVLEGLIALRLAHAEEQHRVEVLLHRDSGGSL